MGIAQRAQRLHKIRRGNVKAAFPLNRLQHNRRHLIGRDIRFENALQALHRVGGGNAMGGVRVDGVINRARERAETNLVRRHFAGQRHGHKRTTVEAAAEGNQPRTAGISARDFHRVFNRFCPRGKKGGFRRTVNRRQFVNPLGQRDIAFVRDNLVSRVGKGLQLLFNGGNDFWVAMAGIQHRDAGGEIDHLIPFNIPQRSVLRFLNKVAAHHPYAAWSRLLATLIQF